jgi:hypothetical protein
LCEFRSLTGVRRANSFFSATHCSLTSRVGTDSPASFAPRRGGVSPQPSGSRDQDTRCRHTVGEDSNPGPPQTGGSAETDRTSGSIVETRLGLVRGDLLVDLEPQGHHRMKHAGRIVQDQIVKVVRNGEGGSRIGRQPIPRSTPSSLGRRRTRCRFGGGAARGTGDTSSVEGARTS